MARDNYSYKRYQKELARKKKKEEKAQRKLNNKKIKDGEVSEPQATSQDIQSPEV